MGGKNHNKGIPFEGLKQEGVNKDKRDGIIRTTSDNLTETISKRPNLKKGNVVIINGLKYHFNGKDRFIIDKNAEKSAKLQGKDYKEVVATLELKLKLLKGKQYAPRHAFEVEELDKMGKEEIERRIGLATVLEEYGIKVLKFDKFERHLGKIKRTEELKSKLDQLKGKQYAPRHAFEVEELDKMGKEEIERRIGLATVLEEYGIKVLKFDKFERHLGKIKRTEELKSKLDQLKGKPYAPEFAFQVVNLQKTL